MKNFKPELCGNGYFWFMHKPCADEGKAAVAEVLDVLITEEGRICFVLRCGFCGETETLKIFPLQGQEQVAAPIHLTFTVEKLLTTLLQKKIA